METKAINLNTVALKYGVVLGLANIVLALVDYIVDPGLLANILLGLAALVAFIFALIFISKSIRKVNGGFISFGKLFWILLITLIISGVISSAFRVVLFTVIDPQYASVLKEKTKKKTYDMLVRFNVPEDQIDETMKKLDKADYGPGLKNTSKELMWVLIFSAIMALIFAAIFKKNNIPNYESLLDSGQNQQS